MAQETVVEKEKKNFTTMNFAELKKVAAKAGVRTSDLAAEEKERLVKRIILKKYGEAKTYIPGLTRCQFCGDEVRVTGTTRDIEDGQMIIVRTVKCTGRNAHTYPLKEIYREDEKNIAGEKGEKTKI